MDAPEISIIVPVYKVEAYLDKCVKSILAQEYKNFELILIDDGSPDRCGEICEYYKKKDSRVRVAHQENRGLAAARNLGISMSRGRYLAFVDSDDWISGLMYKILYLAAKKTDADIIQCDFFMLEEEAVLDHTEEKIKASVQSGKKAIYNMYGKRGLMYTIVWNKLYKREMFEKIRFPDGRIHEDEFINYKLFYYSQKVAIVWKKLYYYRQRAESILHQEYDRGRLDKYMALNQRMRFLLNRKEKILYQETLRFYIKNLMNDYKVCYYQKAEPKIKREILFMILAMSLQFWRAGRIPAEDKRKLFHFLVLPLWFQELFGL